LPQAARRKVAAVRETPFQPPPHLVSRMENETSRIAAKVEAGQLFRLMGKKNESVEAMRALIAPDSGSGLTMSAHRRSVLQFFDELVAGRAAPVQGRQGKAAKSSRIRRKSKPQKQRTPSLHQLTPSEIEKARRLLATGDISVAHVAKRFGVSITLLRRHGLALKNRVYLTDDSYARREKRSTQWGARGT
jgi:hypothetical protein